MNDRAALKRFPGENWYSAIILTTLMVAGFYIRVGGWIEYYFSTDDLWHLVLSKQDSILGVLKANITEDLHPPLSYIMLYFMQKISNNEYFLRCISLIPGMLLIPMTYYLGRERFGLVGATVMAFLTTFGEWTVVLSGAIRGYSLMLFCVTYGLWAMYCFDRTGRKKYVMGYFVSMFLALELVHSVAFFIFATGSWWFLKNIFSEGKRKFLIGWVCGHIILALCLLAYVVALEYFGYKRAPGFLFTSSFLEQYTTLIAYDLLKLLSFMQTTSSSVYEGIFLVAFLSFFIGFYYTIVKKEWVGAYLFICSFLLITLADYLKFFPFTACFRHVIFLVLPFYSIIALTLQSLSDSCFGWEKMEDPRMRKALASAGMILLIVISVMLSMRIAQDNFYRNTDAGSFESSVKKPVLHDTLSFLATHVEPGDIVITSSQTTWVLRYVLGLSPVIHHNDYVAELKSFKVPIYFDGRPGRLYDQFTDFDSVQKFFKEMKKIVDISKAKRIWFLHIGWNSDVISMLMRPPLVPLSFQKYCALSFDSCDANEYKFIQERYSLSWKFFLSPAVTPRWVHHEGKGAAVAYGVTPDFIENILLNQKFVNIQKDVGERLKQRK